MRASEVLPDGSEKDLENGSDDKKTAGQKFLAFIEKVARNRNLYLVTELMTLAPEVVLTYLNVTREWTGPEYLAYETHLNQGYLDLVNALMLLEVALSSYTLDQLRHADLFTMLRYIERSLAVLTVALYWTLINETGFNWDDFYLHGLNLGILVIGELFRGDQCVPNFDSSLALNGLKFLTPFLFLGLYITANALLTKYAGLTNDDGNPIYAKLPWLTDPETAGKWSGVGGGGMLVVDAGLLALDRFYNKLKNAAIVCLGGNPDDYVRMQEEPSRVADSSCRERLAASAAALIARCRRGVRVNTDAEVVQTPTHQQTGLTPR